MVLIRMDVREEDCTCKKTAIYSRDLNHWVLTTESLKASSTKDFILYQIYISRPITCATSLFLSFSSLIVEGLKDCFC